MKHARLSNSAGSENAENRAFHDKDGAILWLSAATELHIKEKHRIQDTVGFITQTLREPVAILQSKWEAGTRIYFKPTGHLYQAVVVSWTQRRIKTAHLMRAIEGGQPLWRDPNLRD